MQWSFSLSLSLFLSLARDFEARLYVRRAIARVAQFMRDFFRFDD